MPLPPAHFLVGAGAAEAARPGDASRWRVWLVGGAVGVLPDMDTGVGILLGRGAEFHGYFTHTPAAVLTIAVIAWLVADRRWAVISAAAYASHLVIDLLEDRGATSVQPLWPFSDARMDSLFTLFPAVPWRRGAGPEGAALSLLDPQVLRWLLAQTAVAAVVFALAVGIRSLLERGARQRRTSSTADPARSEG